MLKISHYITTHNTCNDTQDLNTGCQWTKHTTYYTHEMTHLQDPNTGRQWTKHTTYYTHEMTHKTRTQVTSGQSTQHTTHMQ